MEIRPLDEADRGYALMSWREAHKTSPGCARAPWWSYKREYGAVFGELINAPSTVLLGAYAHEACADFSMKGALLGFLVMTPGKSVHTLHWVQVKSKVDGERVPDRREIAFELIAAAKLGPRFIYTLRGPRCRQDGAKSLDEVLVHALRARGVHATYVAIKEWLQ